VRNALHPTKSQLINTTVAILDSKFPSEVAVDEILEAAGISKGSLYHHFEDLGELLEIAQVERYSQWVDRSITVLIKLVSSANTRDDLLLGLKKMTRLTQAPELANTRFERARAISNAEHSPRFKQALANEQARLTDALIDLIEESRHKGLFSSEFDSRACAVLVQAYTLGKILDDFVDDRMEPEAWYTLIDLIVDRVFLIQER